MGAYGQRALTAGLLALTATTSPTALAQESGGLTTTAEFAQRFELSDNPDNRINDFNDGETFLSRTSLSFGVVSENDSARLRFDVGATLKYVLATSSTFPIREGLADPFAVFQYGTSSANSAFDFSASYSRSDVGDLRTVESPDGSDLIISSGQVERTRFALGYETGIESPIGFEFDTFYNRQVYSDTLDPELNNREEFRADGAIRFTLTPTLDARILAGVGQQNELAVPAIDRRFYSAGIGLDYALSQTQSIRFDITSDLIDTTRRFDGLSFEDREEGYSTLLAYDQELRNGRFGFEVSSILESVGQRNVIAFDRDFEWARGQVELRIGATENATAGAQPLARIRVTNDLPTGEIGLTYDDRRRLDFQDVQFRDRVLTFNVDQAIGPRSSWGFLAGIADTKNLDGLGLDRRRLDIAIDYRRSITRDWDIVGGYSYQDSETEGTARRTRNTLFFTLVRDFEARP